MIPLRSMRATTPPPGSSASIPGAGMAATAARSASWTAPTPTPNTRARRRRSVSAALVRTLLPLDGSRRLAGVIVDHAVDAADFVDDAGGDAAQKCRLERVEIRRHAVRRCHGAQGADMAVRAAAIY